MRRSSLCLGWAILGIGISRCDLVGERWRRDEGKEGKEWLKLWFQTENGMDFRFMI